MKKYLVISPDGVTVLDVMIVPSVITGYNTRAGSNVNKKRFLLPVTNESTPFVDKYQKLSAPIYTLRPTDADIRYDVIDLSSDEKASIDNGEARVFLSSTDSRVARVVEDLYHMQKGEIADLPAAVKDLFAARAAARTKVR